MKYGLNTDFVIYIGCVQAVKKYIKSLDISVQSNDSFNMITSLTIIGKVQKRTKGFYDTLVENESNPNAALNGTAHCLTILTGIQHVTIFNF